MPLPPEAMDQLQSVTTQDDTQALSMFTLQLSNWDSDALRFAWSDSPLFAVGNEVEIFLGYLGDLHSVLLGDIVSLEPVFSAEQGPVLTVRGYDRGHRLARSRNSRTFLDMKDSELASRIARDGGLRAEVQDSAVMHQYVIQANESDWEFLRRRAALIGYQVFVQQRTLYFRRVSMAEPAAGMLSLGQDITEFSPRLSALNQASSVSTGYWEVGKKEFYTATAQATIAVPGLQAGPSVAEAAFGAAPVASLGQPAWSLAEADVIAQSQFDAIAMAFVAGDVVAYGRPELLAGSIVDISGAGDTFSGNYYVTSVTHDVNPESGYRTTFSVQRNAA